MARIAVDMDEVIADFNAKFITSLNSRFDKQLTLADLYNTKIEYLLPELIQDIKAMIREADFFADLPVMPHSQSVLAQMVNQHEIFITTAAMEFPLSFNAKFNWLQQHFPFIDPMNIVFCGYKTIINADYLIDDNVHHFSKFRGEGILFTSPHNVAVEGFRRVNNWQEVAEIFLG